MEQLITWRKSRRSEEHGDACVEVAGLAGGVGVRDSKDPDGPKFVLSHADYRALVNALKE